MPITHRVLSTRLLLLLAGTIPLLLVHQPAQADVVSDSVQSQTIDLSHVSNTPQFHGVNEKLSKIVVDLGMRRYFAQDPGPQWVQNQPYASQARKADSDRSGDIEYLSAVEVFQSLLG